MVETDLRTALLNDIDLVALVGSRVSFSMAEANEQRPYIVVTTVTHDPAGRTPAGSGRLRHVSFQFDCVADTPLLAKQVADVLCDSFEQLTGGSAADTRFVRCWCTDRGTDEYDPPQNASERGLFTTRVEGTVAACDLTGLPAPP